MKNNDFINGLLNDIAEEMEEFNECCGGSIDIPFYMAVISQAFLNGEYEEFLKDLRENIYSINFTKSSESFLDNYSIAFYILEQCDENDCREKYWYNMELEANEKWEGFCECSILDEGYDVKHGCCGEYCDWCVPGFSITKVEKIGEYEFIGKQRDLWKFQEEFIKKREEKQREDEIREKREGLLYEIERREKEIESLKNELNNL